MSEQSPGWPYPYGKDLRYTDFLGFDLGWVANFHAPGNDAIDVQLVSKEHWTTPGFLEVVGSGKDQGRCGGEEVSGVVRNDTLRRCGLVFVGVADVDRDDRGGWSAVAGDVGDVSGSCVVCKADISTCFGVPLCAAVAYSVNLRVQGARSAGQLIPRRRSTLFRTVVGGLLTCADASLWVAEQLRCGMYRINEPERFTPTARVENLRVQLGRENVPKWRQRDECDNATCCAYARRLAPS